MPKIRQHGGFLPCYGDFVLVKLNQSVFRLVLWGKIKLVCIENMSVESAVCYHQEISKPSLEIVDFCVL
jgi:hypothetical protein